MLVLEDGLLLLADHVPIVPISVPWFLMLVTGSCHHTLGSLQELISLPPVPVSVPQIVFQKVCRLIFL